MEKERESLGERVRRLRMAKGLSLEGLRDLSGVAKSHISRIENGNINVGVQTLCDIASGLGVSDFELFAIARRKPLAPDEQAIAGKERFWEMYSDIPPQCQTDVMDLLAVLQRNHSISQRRDRAVAARTAIAAQGEAGALRKSHPHANVILDTEHPVEQIEVDQFNLNLQDETPEQRKRRLAEDTTKPERGKKRA